MTFGLRNSYINAINATAITVPNVSVVAGDLIIFAVREDKALASSTLSEVASTGGSNTYDQVGTGATTANATTACRVYYAIAKATELLNITWTSTNTTPWYMTAVVHVVSGARPTLNSVLDTYAFSAAEGASGTTHQSDTINTANAIDYLFSFWHQDQANSISLSDNGTGFTKRQEHTNWTVGGPSTSFDKIVSSTGAYNSQTLGSATSFEGSVLVAFKQGAPSIDSFSSNVSGVVSGGAVILSWSALGATSYSIDNGVGACTSPITVYPTVNTAYTLTATNAVGNSTAQVSIQIIAAAFQLNAFQNDAFQVTTPGGAYDATRMLAMF